MERLTELAISRRSPKLGGAPRFNGEVLGAITLAKLPRLLGRRVSGRSLRHSLIGVLDVFDNPRVWTGRLEPSFHLNPYRQRLLSARAHEEGGSGSFGAQRCGGSFLGLTTVAHRQGVSIRATVRPLL